MYVWTREGLGDAPVPTTLRMRKDVCPPTYAAGERTTSHSAKGHLNPDVTQFDGRLLIADFGVDSFGVKTATKRENLLNDWLARFENDPTYRLRILGYSDCIGLEKHNQPLRTNRAKRVHLLLGPKARKRVISVDAAAAGTYVPGTDNSTVEGRAKNRGVVVEFWQEPKPGSQGTTDKPKPGGGGKPIDWTPPDWITEGSVIAKRPPGSPQPLPPGPGPAPTKKGSSVRDKLRDKGRDVLRSVRVPEWARDSILDAAEKGAWSAVDAGLQAADVTGSAKDAAIGTMKELFKREP